MSDSTYGPWLELQEFMARDHHWSYASLGKEAGFSGQYVRLLAQGERRVTPQAIRRLSDALKLPYSVLKPHQRDDDTDQQIGTPETAAGAA